MIFPIHKSDHSSMKKYIQLFLTFFKIGFVAFGGGYSMIPLIEREVVDKKEWVKGDEVLDIFAVSESIPGSLSINNSILIGYKIGKVTGAIVSMIGTVLPSFLIMITLAVLSNKIEDKIILQSAFVGIRIAVAALILNTGMKFVKLTVTDKTSTMLLLCTLFLIIFIGMNAAFMIALGGIIGILNKN